MRRYRIYVRDVPSWHMPYAFKNWKPLSDDVCYEFAEAGAADLALAYLVTHPSILAFRYQADSQFFAASVCQCATNRCRERYRHLRHAGLPVAGDVCVFVFRDWHGRADNVVHAKIIGENDIYHLPHTAFTPVDLETAASAAFFKLTAVSQVG